MWTIYEKLHAGGELELGKNKRATEQASSVRGRISLVCSRDSEETTVAGTKEFREESGGYG